MPMTDTEFNQAIEELRAIWKTYKTVLPSNKAKYYRKYVSKLNEISTKTHMDIEDIALYIG